MKCCSPPIHKKTIVAMATVGQASGAKLKKHSPLRIGDTIMLYFNADKRSKDEAENSGYILSDLSVTNNHSLILFPSDFVNPSLPNVQFATFKILAENKYEAQARFNLEMQNLKASREREALQAGKQGSEEEESVQIAQAKKDVNLELKENRAKQRRLNGEPIFYGHNIQLLHTLTKKYLAASTTETSRTEHTKLKVNLQEQDGKGCIFKILPRYKVQSVGEEVHYSDQVMFESVAAEGQYLHCSRAKFGDVKIKVNKQCNELNLAATDSPLTIVRHYQPNTTEETDKVALKGGGTVRLYHKRHQSYVVAEGSFAGIFASLEEIKRVHRMHPDYRIKAAERSIKGRVETEHFISPQSSHPTTTTTTDPQKSNLKKGKQTVSKTVKVQADIEYQDTNRVSKPETHQWVAMEQQRSSAPLQPRQNIAATSNHDRSHYDTRESERTGLDYFDLGEDRRNIGVIDEDVHFRRKRTENGFKKTSHTSANTFWQIEKLSDSISGEPIMWNEKCRIKHLPTRMYLAVTTIRNSPEPKVKLVSFREDLDNESTVFVLLPTMHQKGGVIHYESYSQIKHCMTDTWLHFNKDEVYQQRQLSYYGLSYNGSIAQDSHTGTTELFQLCAAKELNHEDAFILERVEDELVTNFNYVAGITAVLTNQIKECREFSSWTQGPHHMHQHCHSLHTLDALKDLYHFLNESKSPRMAKNKQKLLRNLKVVELVVYLVEIHRDDTVNDQAVCGTCFKVISKYLEGKSSKNKKYTTPMADYLFSGTVWRTELEDEHSIEEMLISMVKNSPSLLIRDHEFVCQVAKHVVEKLVKYSDTAQAPRLLDALSVLCECNGVPIKKNQDQILSHLREVFQGEGKQIFYTLDVGRYSHPKMDRKMTKHVDQDGYEVSIEMDDDRLYRTDRFEGTPLLPHSQYINLRRDPYHTNPNEIFADNFYRNPLDKYRLDESMTSTRMKFLGSQLKLFVKLCLGDNRRVMGAFLAEPEQNEKSQSFGVQITFDHIMRALDARIHPRLKTTYVELLQAMFVDVGKNRPFLDQLPYSFKLMEVKEIPFADTVGGHSGHMGDITALTKVQNVYFPDIKNWIENYFDTMQPLAADQTSENLLLAQILKLLATLVKYGYYDDPEDILYPLEKIFMILDGKNDSPTDQIRVFRRKERSRIWNSRGNYLPYSWNVTLSSSHRQQRERELDIGGEEFRLRDLKRKDMIHQQKVFFTSDRFKNEDVNKSVFKVKKCAMEVLDLLFKYRFYRRLHLFIYDYRRCINRGEYDKQLAIVKELVEEPSDWKQEYTCVSFCCCCTAGKKNARKKQFACNHPRFVKGARERLEFLFSKSDLNLNKDNELPRILLDLANYQDDDLIQGSLQLLDKYFSSEEHLFHSAKQTELLTTTKSVGFYNELENTILSELRDFLDMKNVMDSFQGMVPTGSSPLERLTQKCWLEGEVVGCEPHHQNQIIICNFGVLSNVMEFVQQYASMSANGRGALMQQNFYTFESRSTVILIQALDLLRALTCGFKEVQKKLFQYVSLFLKIAVIGDVAPYSARLLREIFSGGPVSSLKIKKSEMKQMIDLIFMKSTISGPTISVEGKAELIKVLEELVVVRDLSLPVRHNQNLLIKCFNHIRDDDKYWCKELLREGGKDERLNLLKKEPDSSMKLQLLLMMTDLLAFCAQGENANTESICCTMYTIDEVVKIIVDPDIKLYRKRPFNRFLVWVYMSVEQTDSARNAASLSVNKKIWKWLDKCSTLFTKVGDYMKRITKKDYLLCKECLRAPVYQYAHLMNWKAEKQHTLSFIPGINGPTTEDYISLSDALLYFAEALLPFLQVFYTKFFNFLSCSQTDPKRVISQNIFTTLMKFNEPFSSMKVYFSMEVQVKLYRRVMYVFRHFFSRAKEIKENFPYHCNFQFEEVDGYLNAVIVTEARKVYRDNYRHEIELNKHFHRFVYNYQLAYQGPNNVKSQIGARWRRADQREYSNYLDEDMTKPGHEYLPLGPAFQAHVACFIDHSTRSLHSRIRGDKKVKDLAERLLKQLEISATRFGQLTSQVAQRRQIELDIKCLQILRCIIYNHIMLIDPELKERDPQKYRNQCSAKLHPVQKAIQNFKNAISRVMPLLSHANEEIVYEVLAFLGVILDSNNTAVQEGLQDLINSKEHPMFLTLQRMLKEAAIAYSESQYLSNQIKLQIKRDGMLGLSWTRRLTYKRIEEIKNIPEDTPIGVHCSQDDLQNIPMQDLTRANENRRLRRRKRWNNGAYEPSSLYTNPSNGLRSTQPDTMARRFWKRLRMKAALLASKRLTFNTVDDSKQKRVPFMAVYKHSKSIPGLSRSGVEIVNFHDLSHIELTMKVLGLMCDGQYRDMQNALRKQNDGIQSINIVGEVASFLQVLYQSRIIDSSTIKLLHRMLQTLIEMSTGNCANQGVIFNKQVIPIINHILQLDITNIKRPPLANWMIEEDSHRRQSHGKDVSANTPETLSMDEYRELRKQALELKGSAVELLEGMLEETSLKTKELVTQFSGGLDIEALHGTLIDFYKLKHDKELIQDEYDDNAERGLFRTYHILVHLNHYGIPMEQLEPGRNNVESRKIWEECKKSSKSVEVVYKNTDGEEILTKVNFKFDPRNPIREELIDRVKLQIDRHSVKDKLRDLLEWMAVIKRDTNHHKKLRERKYTFKPLISFGVERYYLLLFLTLLMNVLILQNYTLPPGVKDIENDNTTNFDDLSLIEPQTPKLDKWFSDYVLYIMGGIHLFFAVWMVAEYFVVNWPNFVLPRVFFTNKVVSTIRKSLKPRNHSQRVRTQLYKFLEVPRRSYANVNALGIKTIYVIIFLASSALSLNFSGYFYCLCLLYMIVNNDILQRALQSVTKNVKPLLWVAAFMLSILFIYAVGSFAFFYLSFNSDDLRPLHCDSLFQCFITVVRYGLLSSPGLEIPVYPTNYKVAGIRLLFDVSFFIIIVILGLNTVLGIIVDTFSELRNERREAKHDMKSVCFICGRYGYQFERESDYGFKEHTRNEHNMWAYIYYSLYLDQIDISDHNAIEKYIYKKMKASDIDYFPMNRALALTHTLSDNEKRLNELKTIMNTMMGKFNSLQEMVEKLSQRDVPGVAT